MATWNITVPAGSGVGSGGTAASNITEPGDFDGATINSVTVSGSPTVTTDGATDDTIGIRWRIQTSTGTAIWGDYGSDAASMCWASLGDSATSDVIEAGSSPNPNPSTAVGDDWDQVAYSANYSSNMKDDGETVSWSAFTIVVDYTPSGGETSVTSLLGEIRLSGFQPEAVEKGQYTHGTLNLEGISPGPVTYVYTINPTRGEINFQGFAPTVEVVTPGGATNVTGLLGEINLEGFQPETVERGQYGFGEIHLEGFGPDVDLIRTVDGPANGEINLEGFAATVELFNEYKPALGELNLEGFAGALSITREAFQLLGQTHLEGFAATVELFNEYKPSLGELHIEGFAGATSITREGFPSFGTLHLEGFAATAELFNEYKPDVGILNLEGFAATPAIQREAFPAFGTLHLEGFAATVTAGNELIVNALLGTLNLEGFAASVEQVRRASPQLGVVNADGSIALVSIERTARPSVGEAEIEGFAGVVDALLPAVDANILLGEAQLEGFEPSTTVITIAADAQVESRGGGGKYPDYDDELEVILMVIREFLERAA